MNERSWDELVRAAQTAASETGLAVADVPLELIAQHAGISRATLYRRIESRAALNEAVRRAGIDPGGRADVRERATEAAADLIEAGGLAAMTLEEVAARADCSLRALHTQLGGRDGLISAVFERYSPLPPIERVLADRPRSLEAGVQAIYRNILDAISARPGLLRALIAEVAFRPDGPTAQYLRDSYLPRALSAVIPWLEHHVQSGDIRRIPAPLLLKLLVGPMLAHALLGSALASMSSAEQPNSDDLCDALTGGFIRAVARSPDLSEPHP